MNQKKLPAALPRGAAAGAQAWRPQAGPGHAGADDAAAGAEPALVTGLRRRTRFTDGRRFRILAVVDDFTRECLALVADTSLSGARVARELDAIIARRGASRRCCVSDNGTELTSMAILTWCQESRVDWHYIAAGQAAAERVRRRASSAGCATSA